MDQATQLRNIIKAKPLQPKPVARVITVTSGKGGVGKSSISVNLAIQLRKLGKRVVIMDADFGLANIEVMLGIRPQYNLADLIFKGKSLKEIITSGPEGIGFISGGSGIQELTNLSKEQIIKLSQSLYELDQYVDVVIIDTGAGIADSVLEFVAASNEVLLVVTPEPTSITDAYALLKTLNKKADFLAENTIIKIIANRVATAIEGKEIFDKLSVVVNKFLNIRIEFLGTIPQDNSISKAVIQQNPVTLSYPNAPSSIAITEIAQMLNSNTIVQQQNRKGISHLFSNLIRAKRLK
ncbi:MAG: MinD/ParA family protein [Velocimicrobium sp.]